MGKIKLLPRGTDVFYGDVSMPETLTDLPKDIDAVIFTLGSNGQGRIGKALIVRNMAQEENVVYIDSRYVAVISGADNRSRTYDLRITNALLYQLSYIGLSGRVTSVTTVCKVKKKRVPRQLPSRLVVVFYSTTSLIQHEKHGDYPIHFPYGYVCHQIKQHFFNIGPSYLLFLSNSAILIVNRPRLSPRQNRPIIRQTRYPMCWIEWIN